MEQVTHQLNIEALPTDIPDYITVDVSGMEIAATMHLSEITAARRASCSSTIPEETIIATVVVPTEVEEPEEVEEETELVGEEGEPLEGEAEAAEARRRRASEARDEARRVRRGVREPVSAAAAQAMAAARSTGWSSGSATRATATPARATTSASRWPPRPPSAGACRRPRRSTAASTPTAAPGPGGPRVGVLLPQTHMNDSGRAAGPARGALGVPLDRVVAVHDEIDLPFGRVEARLGGGLAGHNGLKSLKQELGGPDFRRIRVGVGPPRLHRPGDRLGLGAGPLPRAATTRCARSSSARPTRSSGCSRDGRRLETPPRRRSEPRGMPGRPFCVRHVAPIPAHIRPARTPEVDGARRGRPQRAAARLRVGQPAAYLLASLIDLGPGAARARGGRRRPRRPRPGRRPAHFLAPRPVRFYPARGVRYESHLAPPPHLVGLRVAALDALLGERARRCSWPRPSRWPRRCPTRSCARTASRSRRAGCSTSRRRPTSSWPAATSAWTRSRTAASSPSAATSSTSTPPPRSARCAASCSTSRSSGSPASPPSPSARSRRPSGWRSPRRPSWRPSSASWPRSRPRATRTSAPTSPSAARWTASASCSTWCPTTR